MGWSSGTSLFRQIIVALKEDMKEEERRRALPQKSFWGKTFEANVGPLGRAKPMHKRYEIGSLNGHDSSASLRLPCEKPHKKSSIDNPREFIEAMILGWNLATLLLILGLGLEYVASHVEIRWVASPVPRMVSSPNQLQQDAIFVNPNPSPSESPSGSKAHP